MLKKLSSKFLANEKSFSGKSYLCESGRAVWMNREYKKFADEAYIKNVIAHRAINMISSSAASIPLKLYSGENVLHTHQVLKLLSKPNPTQSGKEFLESIYSYRQISGNAFILVICGSNNQPAELYSLRPDRVSIVSDSNLLPKAYSYKVGKQVIEYPVDPITGRSQILHIKNFHPLSDWYGLSSIEAAAYSIDQHNQAGEWNQALLQNGARPSGAIIVDTDGGRDRLTELQYSELKSMIDAIFSGPRNAGRPIILEGGLDWKEMSLSPKDMDFIESKHSSARDIALALGVPPQLLGIPGDNTYSNLQEARLALWEQTILPMAENVIEALSNWLLPFYSSNLSLACDIDNISALSARREEVWNRVENCSFLTINEKRASVGLGPIANGDILR
ncbi:MAG: phage portal protein family [Candidatus Midichloriaceae bacterium]|jgi:HK97 family phage portal protein|nr:phage portal protein family [Candidatus Midichloriaceae bacterium]